MARKKKPPVVTEATTDDDIASILGEAEKRYGRGAIGTLSGKFAFEISDVDYIHTGSLGLDLAIGVGGVPRGRVIEIFGHESSGKTTLALHIIANAQKVGGLCGFVDAEHALDPTYAEALGVDLSTLMFSQPDSGEQALEIAETMVRSEKVSVVVIDSVAALVPQAELDGDMGDHHPGAQARLMSQALRKLTSAVKKTNTLVIFINQTRNKIGVRFGSPVTTSGGKALKFYASIRIEVTRIGSVKKADVVSANRTKVKIVKNKCAPPFRTCEFDLKFGEGIDWATELLDMGTGNNLITKAGSWYSYKDTRMGQGRISAATWLRENEEAAQEIREALT